MSELTWPGLHRAGDLASDARLVRAMVAVEDAWLRVLVEHEVAPPDAGADLAALVVDDDVPRLAQGLEQSGTPVLPLLDLLRSRLAETAEPGEISTAAAWLHRGLTSQDVVDSALMLCARDVGQDLLGALEAQVRLLGQLAATHRDTPMTGRTLTQPAVPTTFGLKVSGWLTGVLDAYDDLARAAYPVQVGGAAGTLAALVELGGAHRAEACVAGLAAALGLATAEPWHTTRTAVTRFGDALVRCTDAWGRIARDVLVLGRPEIGEVIDASGGGSSTMPHKANPVLATLVHRAALTTPALAATLHTAAADQVDERADGAWHAEWETLVLLLRRTLVAAGQTTDLLHSLRVDPDRMWGNLTKVVDDLLAEQRAVAELAGHRPTGHYLGLAGRIVDATLVRAECVAGESS